MKGSSPSSQPSGPAQPLPVRSTKIDQQLKPDLKQVKSVVLRDSAKVRKVAAHTVVRDRHTGHVHHDALTLRTWRKLRDRCESDPAHSISLDSEGEDEIQRLTDFLYACRSGAVPEKTGEFLVVAAPVAGPGDTRHLQQVLNDLSHAGKAEMLADVLRQAAKDRKLLDVLLERAARDPELFAEAAAALNLATYRKAVADLEQLIATSDKEQDFQVLLSRHPWMFGSEYSELLDRRRWTRDENQDFIVRRTSDGYIELIEIKTPLGGAPLFRRDESHDSYFAGQDLSRVVGQIQKYIEKLDADRYAIRANDGEDTAKIRAKVILGRDGDEVQRQALRRFNGHLHRIEVITFDQLLRIARRVLGYLGDVLSPAGG